MQILMLEGLKSSPYMQIRTGDKLWLLFEDIINSLS
jgi:hypothetical protein